MYIHKILQNETTAYLEFLVALVKLYYKHCIWQKRRQKLFFIIIRKPWFSISLDLGVISLLTMTSTLSSRENIFMKSNLQSAIWQNISWIQFCSRSSCFKKNILNTSCQIKEWWLYQVIRWRHITESIHFNWCSYGWES